MKYVFTILIVLVILGGGALFFAWSGIYNIAATKPHWNITARYIEMLRNRSIAVRSDNIQVPKIGAGDTEKAAFVHYHEMCRFCHGAPDLPSKEFAKGLYPKPPSMTTGHIQEEYSTAQIYWTIKHGIKLTGMPAFSPTHGESEMWNLVSLVQEIHQMAPEKYRQMIPANQAEAEGDHGHAHQYRNEP
ncbi:MAG: c-type cytochrome [Desulfobacterales bacterium]